MEWFISDPHYGHVNICRGTSSWSDKTGCRDFSSIEEMNDAIVNSINKYVKEEDTLYILGDVSFGGIDNIPKFIERIICDNIILITGNHDQHIKNGKSVQRLGETIPLRSLFKEIHSLLEVRIENLEIIMSHFPIEDWNHQAGKKIIHLHGHVHGKYNSNQKPYRIDVSIESALFYFGEIRPFSINDIIFISYGGF